MVNNRKPLVIRNAVILGLYQLIGGLSGIGIIAYSLTRGFELETINIIIFIVFIMFFGFSAYCGIACIKKEKKAFYLSRINQYLQLVNFAGQSLGYHFVAGLGLFVGVDLEGGLLFNMKFSFTELSFSYAENSDDKQIAINLVALFLIFNFNTLIKEQKDLSIQMLE